MSSGTKIFYLALAAMMGGIGWYNMQPKAPVQGERCAAGQAMKTGADGKQYVCTQDNVWKPAQ